MSTSATSNEHRASNGIFYRMEGEGEPLLLLHGLMVAGAMFDPLVALLRDRFRMLIPDLRGHGKSGDLDGPYDVAALAADLDTVLTEARFDRCAVMGYSHGGAVAQQLARDRPAVVSKLILACTYACNVATLRERLEGEVFAALLRVCSPGTLAKLILRPSKPKPTGAIGLTKAQVDWLRSIMAANRAPAMRGAVRGPRGFPAPRAAWSSAPVIRLSGRIRGSLPTSCAREAASTRPAGRPRCEARLASGAGCGEGYARGRGVGTSLVR